jgi:hypothetical protein
LSKPNSFAISSIVKPSIIFISVIITKNMKKINIFVNLRKKYLTYFRIYAII